MVVQQLVSTKIPPDWVDHLDKLVVTKNLSRSALVKVAIGQYLGLSEVDPAIVTVDLRSQLDDIRARLEALERSTKPSTISSTNVSTIPSTDVSTPSIAAVTKSNTIPNTTPPIAGAMTIGELHKALQDLGYPNGQANLSKQINKARATEKLPDDLMRLGVVADWETRASTSNFNNQCRWLRIQ